MKKIRLFYKIILFCIGSCLLTIISLYTYAYFSKPIKLNSIGTYKLYDNNENLVYQGNSKNKWVNLKEISPYLINAVISVEDKEFYNHNGFDIPRIFKALLKDIKYQKIVEGASTISQQYIKNAYLTFDKTWKRKIKEAFLTINLEVHYSKDEILEAYLNTINFGQGNYGIENAAKYYFGKSAKDLSLEESIILAGIPKSPNNYNPISNYEKSIKRAKVVAKSMFINNKISKKEYKNLFNNEVIINSHNNKEELKTLMYYQEAVINELKRIKGIDQNLILSGNLNVYTTLDLNTQKILENEIKNNITDEKMQVASVIINPQDGSILALTGGKDYTNSQYNRALYSKRQVGSTMKPFLYYAALDNGMVSSSTFLSQYTSFSLDNGTNYAPKNYGNIYANKDITMATAIAYSDNIYAVKTNLFLGEDKMVNVAHLCGIDEKLNAVASLALGTTELNILDFADGYTTLASGGYNKDIHMITKVTDKNGKVLYLNKEKNNLVLNPNYIYILNELLTSTTNSNFIDYNTPTALSIASKLSKKYAIKTGTTDYDYWTVGYNKNILMLTWSGYDDNKKVDVLKGNKTKNIFANVITQIDNNNEDSWYKMPTNIVGIPLNAIDGKETTKNTNANIYYYVKGSEPYFYENKKEN